MSLYKIANDIRLMSCGPRAGFHELDFVVNRKTAQALGLAISREFELRADEVIE